MLGMLVVTHGQLAEVLVNAARRIVGEVEALEALSMEWDAEVDQAVDRIEKAIERVDRGAGVLVVMHDINLAARYSDRMVLLKDGKILSDGPPDKVLTQGLVETAFGVRSEIISLQDGRRQLILSP